jgi:hypothetical protein
VEKGTVSASKRSLGMFLLGIVVHLGRVEMQSQIDQFTNAIRHLCLVFGSLYDAAITKGSRICRPVGRTLRM